MVEAGIEMLPVQPVVIEDTVVRLAPLSLEDVESLHEAASGSRDTYALARVPASLAEARAYVELALEELARGVSLPFVTRDARTGRALGSTRFLSIERWKWPQPGHRLQRAPEFADAVEIGATWLARDAQRTGVNTHAKLLMLTHAFESWRVHRVSLKTDARNARSRAAIERIGARFDGVLRAYMPAFDGEIRHTAFFSILAPEWPEVKARLHALAR